MRMLSSCAPKMHALLLVLCLFAAHRLARADVYEQIVEMGDVEETMKMEKESGFLKAISPGGKLYNPDKDLTLILPNDDVLEELIKEAADKEGVTPEEFEEDDERM